MVETMWCYGTTKDQLQATLAVPFEERRPSNGIIRFSCDIPSISPDEVLIEVKASALNYNSIWSSLAHPVDPFNLISGFVKRNPVYADHEKAFAIFGSDASGVVVGLGEAVTELNIGDEVVVHCNMVEASDPTAQQDGMLSRSQGIWGYESNYGAFAQFTKVHKSQVLKKPDNIGFEQAASLMLTLSTAYRMLISPNGANLRAGQTVLIWGAAGGLGSYAIQLAKLSGCKVVAVVSGNEKYEHVKNLGADYVIDRAEGSFGQLVLEDGSPNYLGWAKAKRHLARNGVPEIDVVFEHVGAATLGFSIYIAKRGGKIVTCAASSGYNATIDLRYLWMELKTLIGSHFANNYEAQQALELVRSGSIAPVVDSVSHISELPQKMDDMLRGDVMGKIVFSHT